MSVFVAGATGVIGKRLVESLSDRGHEVVGLVRDDEGERVVAERGGTPRRGDVLDAGSLERAVPDDVESVVHAATALPDGFDAPDEAWERNDRVRVEGARNLVAAAGDAADRFYFPSVVWVARQPDGSEIDETAERNPDRFTGSAAETEEYLQGAGEEHGFEVGVLRNGLFYGAEDRATRKFAEQLLAGDLPIVGGGLLGRRDAELSLLHVADAGPAMAAAVDAELSGVYHVVDGHPVTLAEYLRTLADLVDAPEPRRIPWWVARPFAGKDAVRFMTTGFPTAAERFREATDWEPEYPGYSEGIRDAVATWERDGTLARLRGEATGDGVDPREGTA